MQRHLYETPVCAKSPVDYKPEFYYWEMVDCLRKLLLTGVAVVIAPGSLIQLVVSLAVIVVYAIAVTQFQPYRMARDNILALVLYSMLAVTLFIGLLLKVKDGYENSGKFIPISQRLLC